MNYAKALEFATRKHGGQFRKEGTEYITHPIAVSQILKDLGYGVEYQITGLFHDLLEDTDATEEEILSLSNEDVLKAVKLLTKQDGYIMKDYIADISNNKLAISVKLADRLHNLRSAGAADEKFIKKYIDETTNYYLDLAEGTEFEGDIIWNLGRLEAKLVNTNIVPGVKIYLYDEDIIYADLKLIFNISRINCERYNWLITGIKLDVITCDLFKKSTGDYYIDGEKLKKSINNASQKINSGILSAIPTDCRLNKEELLAINLPDTESIDLFYPEVVMQHPLAEIEIVYFDNSFVIIKSIHQHIIDDILNNIPSAQDLCTANLELL